jgi:hypothetical protein
MRSFTNSGKKFLIIKILTYGAYRAALTSGSFVSRPHLTVRRSYSGLRAEIGRIDKDPFLI